MKELHATEKLISAHIAILQSANPKQEIAESGFHSLVKQCRSELQTKLGFSYSEADALTRPLQEGIAFIRNGRSAADDAARCSFRKSFRSFSWYGHDL